ncbi:MAG: hypothetical protein K0V04_22905 [Deltaproteobacteria bacterium]|nr:hypothetical protein [Deltaproteobacteria bacterium]
MPALGRRLLLASSLLLPGCAKIQSLLGLDGDDPKPEENKDKAPQPETKAAAADDDGGAPPEPLVQATRKLRFPGKSTEHMGFDLSKLSSLYALAGAVEVPEWSDTGHGPPRIVRDDDLRSSWSCTLAPDQTCAIGIHFPNEADVEVLRLQLRSPAEDPKYARPRRIRVHTGPGWAEATVPNEDGPWHLALGEPITTRNLSVEIIETHGEGAVHIAELEVYGRRGSPRAPLELQPDRRVVSLREPVWSRRSRTHTASTGFVEEVDVDARLRRVIEGSALFGQRGDRLMLVERLLWTTCDDHQAAYDLLDTKTRVVMPMGDMGGFGRQIFRHADGLGFAVAQIDGQEGSVQAVVIDHDRYEHRTSNRLDRRTPHELLRSWKFEPDPLLRADATAPTNPPASCGAARIEQLDALRPHLPRRTKIIADQWHSCSLDNGYQVLMSTMGECGKQWHVAVLDSEGGLMGERSGKESNSHFRLRRLDSETILIERWGDDDRPSAMLVDSDGPHDVAGTVALSQRPPAGCRTSCGLDFADLTAPKR